jgi:hypothetical protein
MAEGAGGREREAEELAETMLDIANINARKW